MEKKARFILLADDDMEDQEILKEAISAIDPDAKVQSFLDGNQLIQYLINHASDKRPCLIILDYNMHAVTAPELLDKMTRIPHYQSIPKVIWSSSTQKEHIKKCMERGVHNYFFKPTDSAQLTSITRQMLTICDHASKG